MPTDIPLVQFFCKPVPQERLSRICKISEEDSLHVNEFIKYGFDPVIETQKSIPEHEKLNAWAYVKGDEELRDDWDTLPRKDVFCLIRWNTDDAIDPTLRRFTKNFFECLLGLREYPSRITRSQQDWINRIRPYKTDKPKIQSQFLEGEKLPDGRTVIKIEGGERESQVSEMLAAIDTSFLDTLPRNCAQMIME
jgi:hypothetical protein